ncbi:glycosyl hydrolase [Micromonospora sp. M12]
MTPATSKRKGVGVWTFDGVSQALASSGASWYYTWDVAHQGVTSPQGAEFVPMIWGRRASPPPTCNRPSGTAVTCSASTSRTWVVRRR